MTSPLRDHGGGIDAAMRRYGGARAGWLDLSTGINPVPYPLPDLPADVWTALPDSGAQAALMAAARRFWKVPEGALGIAASGVSPLIALIPLLAERGTVRIAPPTYNEHAAAFRAQGWDVQDGTGQAQVEVHPNNPDGRVADAQELMAGHDRLTVIDESFCDTCPDRSLIDLTRTPGVIVLKGLGKFWGLAGVRLGFAFAHPETLAPLADLIGPWAISGPAQVIGRAALEDDGWAEVTRDRLARDRRVLDRIMVASGARIAGGTDLFGLYHVSNAAQVHDALARHHILTRMFPYSDSFLRLGLPADDAARTRLRSALESGR